MPVYFFNVVAHCVIRLFHRWGVMAAQPLVVQASVYSGAILSWLMMTPKGHL